jgi:2-amino-4-hydroxy-6-hydroxymethyldihydropteridine diphosphokinase
MTGTAAGATVYIALGSNLGDRAAALHAAVAHLEAIMDHPTYSSVYETDPVGYADQGPFLNAAVGGFTTLTPQALLGALLRIEHELGRARSFPNAPRTIDLDLLLYAERILDTPSLTLPHPRMHERAFVLAPLADIAPELRHPRLGRTIAELYAALDAQQGIQASGVALP